MNLNITVLEKMNLWDRKRQVLISAAEFTQKIATKSRGLFFSIFICVSISESAVPKLELKYGD